jgi:hypothetical protein
MSGLGCRARDVSRAPVSPPVKGKSNPRKVTLLDRNEPKAWRVLLDAIAEDERIDPELFELKNWF